MRLPLDQWLEQSVDSKHGALLRYTKFLKTLIEDNIKPNDAAKELVDSTSSSRDKPDTAYRL